MRFLVTGGAGFIGSNLAFTLEAQGHEVVILDNFSSGHFKNLIGFKGYVRSGDICCRASFDTLEGKFDAIFHEAAITDTTVMDQARMMDVNVEGFRNALAFAAQRKIKRVVYASSAGVYGNGACPMAETAMPTPENVYGFSKAIMDNVARDFAAAHKNMVLVGLRYFNVYGPGEYFKGKFASMIYQLYLQMKAGKKPRIFKSGEQQRDFVYIKDIVSANLLALKAKKSCVLNAATGVPEDFNRVIACLNKEMGLSLATEYIDNPYAFFQNKTQAETSLAKKTTGYAAAYTLDKGIAEYVAELKKRGA
jgi:ADP-L-glycero-D-manno-heptose 6-epimerase